MSAPAHVPIGFLNRRLQLLKYGFLGTGRLRNLAWLIMI